MCISLLLVLFIFSSCGSDIYSDVGRENLEIIYGINFVGYRYFDKVYINLHGPKREDKLEILDEVNDEWYTVLEGKFNEVCYNDGHIFIRINDEFYDYDVNSEVIQPTTDSDGDYLIGAKPEFDLKKYYSVNDFVESYPEYESFEWFSY